MEVSIEGNKLIITLGELEARVATRALPLMKPLLSQLIYGWSRLIMHMSTLSVEERKKLEEKLERGEPISQLLSDMGISLETLMDETIEYPSNEELDRAFGWLDE